MFEDTVFQFNSLSYHTKHKFKRIFSKHFLMKKIG